MKNSILLILCCFFLLTNCSLDNDNTTTDPETYIIEWHLTEVNGGIAGVDLQFDLGTVVWRFIDEDTLTIVNDNDDDTKEDFLDSATYTYSELEVASNTYLVIDGTEYGEFSFSSANNLVIDGNEFSSGSGADGFIYTFSRVLVLED